MLFDFVFCVLVAACLFVFAAAAATVIAAVPEWVATAERAGCF